LGIATYAPDPYPITLLIMDGCSHIIKKWSKYETPTPHVMQTMTATKTDVPYKPFFDKNHPIFLPIYKYGSRSSKNIYGF
jgi:hypothetical protein